MEQLTPLQKSKQMIKSFQDNGFKKEHKCIKMAIVACDLIIQETLEEYTNDEGHVRVVFYGEVKNFLSNMMNKPKEKTFLDFKYKEEKCLHKNVVEELSGGRRDVCKDCGKTW